MGKKTALRALLAAGVLTAPAYAREGGSAALQRAGALAFVGSAPGAMMLRGGMRPAAAASAAHLSMGAGDLETMVQDKIKSNKAMVFSKSRCPFCTKAKKAMDELGIKYEVMELDQRDDGQDIQDIMLAMTGGRSVPRVFINGQFIGGGDDTVAKAASGELAKLYKA